MQLSGLGNHPCHLPAQPMRPLVITREVVSRHDKRADGAKTACL
jgi:hypothetical protein